ncbi:sugar ABC transporter permease [Brevibacillus sp. TJ4]|uniref:sugar ABC transporter permease n=1 Tax=Brevibacillus sp. TJ4 TaxID=3234853 RepID=UPI0037D57210
MEKQKQKLSFRFDVRAYTLLIALIVIAVLFSILTDGGFLTSRNLSNLFRQMSVISILAIGMTLVIVAAQIDLSVGSIVGLTGGIAAILQVWHDWGTIPAVLVAILAGAVIGLLQGWLVAYRAVPAFIVTLGGMMVWRGVLLGVSNGETIAPLQEDFVQIGQSYLPYVWGYVLAAVMCIGIFVATFRRRQKRAKLQLPLNSSLIDYGKALAYSIVFMGIAYMMNRYYGIPIPVLIVLLLGLIFLFISTKTGFGRYIYAIGGNPEAAKYSGINIKAHTLSVFVMMGALAGVAGVVLTSRLNAATVGAGQSFELDAIAAVVIGGTSLAGGTGSIVGSIIGALVMVSLDNGMSMMNVQPFWQYIVKGSILVFAVWLDIATKNKS